MFVMNMRAIMIFTLLIITASLTQAYQWQFLGLSGKQVLSVSVDPDNTQNICAGTDAGLYVSFDGGQNWAVRLSIYAPFPFLSYTPQSSDTLIALFSEGSYSDGIYISINNGNSWAPINESFMYPRRLGFDPVNPGYIYICFPDGILKSQDYGEHISDANDGLPGTNILDVKGDGVNQYEAYAVGETFVAHTTDFGNNWTPMGGLFGLEDYNPNRLEYEPNGPETLYVTCYLYFARSFNGGVTWQYTSMPTSENTPIACDPQITGVIYVGSVAGGGVLSSTDAGESFIPINDNLGNLNIHSLVINADGNLLAGTGNGIYICDLTSGINDTYPVLPRTLSLSQNYPNPFNSRTLIEFSLESFQYARIDIFDISGRLVKTLFDRNPPRAGGIQSVNWDGADNSGSIVSSGIYLYRLKTDSGSISRKMILLK